MSQTNQNSTRRAVCEAVTQGSSWKFDPRNLTLSYGRPQERYYVKLKECDTSARMLDWIMQVAGKKWATDDVLASLVRDLNQLLSPQGNLCSLGEEQGPINVREVIRQRLAA